MRIGELRFIDGSIRPVYEQKDCRQYVRDDNGTKVYGFWILSPYRDADAPFMIPKLTR
jgi:hypothetical protein